MLQYFGYFMLVLLKRVLCKCAFVCDKFVNRFRIYRRSRVLNRRPANDVAHILASLT
jgi:hypothetical protein